jgi:hypothetical protein
MISALVELSHEAHPTVQKLVQRIFQTLLRLEVPQSDFDRAVESGVRKDSRGNPNRLAQQENMNSAVKVSESAFLQLLCNLV